MLFMPAESASSLPISPRPSCKATCQRPRSRSMNLVQTNLLREVASEVKAKGGLVQFKAHALKHLDLRTVLKESHGSPIVDLVFNTLDPEHRNLFASIGKDQVTIYDDEHMGDFLGVVVHYVNSPTPHHRGGDVGCCAWVRMAGLSCHPLGDAVLAVSGPEGVVQTISVVEARVTRLLKGHSCEVVELRGCAGVPGLLLSLGADGGLRLWDVAAGSCLANMTSDASCVELHPEGSCFFTGHRGGRICRWDLPLPNPPSPTPPGDLDHPHHSSPTRLNPLAALHEATALPTPQPLQLSGSAPGSGSALGDSVECLRCLPGGRLAAQSADGRLVVWQLEGGPGEGVGMESSGLGAQQLVAIRVPGSNTLPGARGGGGGGGGGRCRFSVTTDGAFICVGNPAGDVYVYDSSTGSRAAHYGGHKARGPARAVALSEDGRHLLAVHGNGYILRYEYIRKVAQELRGGDGVGVAPEAVGSGAAEAQEGAEADGEGGEAVTSSRDISPEPPMTEEDGPSVETGGGGVAGGGLEERPAKRPRLERGDGLSECSGEEAGGGEGGRQVGAPEGGAGLVGEDDVDGGAVIVML